MEARGGVAALPPPPPPPPPPPLSRAGGAEDDRFYCTIRAARDISHLTTVDCSALFRMDDFVVFFCHLKG